MSFTSLHSMISSAEGTPQELFNTDHTTLSFFSLGMKGGEAATSLFAPKTLKNGAAPQVAFAGLVSSSGGTSYRTPYRTPHSGPFCGWFFICT